MRFRSAKRELALAWIFFGAAGCDKGDLPGPDVVLPSNYRESFMKVRGCRSSVAHDFANVTVWASPEAAPVYRDGLYPFPRESVLVMEENADSTCLSLTGYTVMKKGGPRADPNYGDWRWVRMDTRFRIGDQGIGCTRCHAQPDCRNRDYVCGGP